MISGGFFFFVPTSRASKGILRGGAAAACLILMDGSAAGELFCQRRAGCECDMAAGETSRANNCTRTGASIPVGGLLLAAALLRLPARWTNLFLLGRV